MTDLSDPHHRQHLRMEALNIASREAVRLSYKTEMTTVQIAEDLMAFVDTDRDNEELVEARQLIEALKHQLLAQSQAASLGGIIVVKEGHTSLTAKSSGDAEPVIHALALKGVYCEAPAGSRATGRWDEVTCEPCLALHPHNQPEPAPCSQEHTAGAGCRDCGK